VGHIGIMSACSTIVGGLCTVAGSIIGIPNAVANTPTTDRFTTIYAKTALVRLVVDTSSCCALSIFLCATFLVELVDLLSRRDLNQIRPCSVKMCMTHKFS